MSDQNGEGEKFWNEKYERFLESIKESTRLLGNKNKEKRLRKKIRRKKK